MSFKGSTVLSGSIREMKKKKEVLKYSFSPVVKVNRHRTEKDRLTIDGILLIEDECRINLKLTLLEDDLHRLFSYALKQESDFIGRFSLILADAIQRIQKGARGKNKGNETTIFWIKTEAGCLYIFFSYWCKKKIQDWPEYLKKLVNIANKDDYTSYLKTSKGKFGAKEMAAYCIEKYYGEDLKKLGLRPYDDLNNFYITYIQPSLKLSKELLKNLKYADMQAIIDTPLGEIFKSFGII